MGGEEVGLQRRKGGGREGEVDGRRQEAVTVCQQRKLASSREEAAAALKAKPRQIVACDGGEVPCGLVCGLT